MHPLVEHFKELRQRVNSFLNQFDDGAEELLNYVGLLGDGKLAQAIRGP